jgi:hypothetical protein
MPKTRNKLANPVKEVRLVRLYNMLLNSKGLSRQAIRDELEIAEATLTRDIALLRDQLNIPVAFDADRGGYFIADSDAIVGYRYQMPGIWLGSHQAAAVLALVNVTMAIDPGVLSQAFLPLRGLVKGMSGLPYGGDLPPIHEKLSIEVASKEGCDPEVFKRLSYALYHDIMVNLGIDGTDETWGNCSLQRYALTRDGWFMDVYRSGNQMVRVPVSRISSVTSCKLPAVRLEYCWQDNTWEDEAGKVLGITET